MQRSPETELFGAKEVSFMERALELATATSKSGEVPVGAVVVSRGQVVGEGANSCIRNSDPTAHAEIMALRDASKFLGNYRLPGAELFVTLEPCTMCAGAIIHARIKRVVFAALDSRSGAVCSRSETFDQKHHNHHVKWAHGLLAEESANLLRSFFLERR